MAQDEEKPPEPKPPAIPAGKWPRPVAPALPVEVALDRLIRELTPAREHKKWSRGQVCALIPVPFVLAAVSWLLGGNNVWAWTAAVSGVLLLLWGVASLEVLRDRDFQLRDFLLAGFVVLCWGAWAAVGYHFPLTAVRLKDDDGDDEPVGPVRLSYDGEMRFEGERRQGAFEIRGRLDPARLKVESLAPTGWVARTFRVYGDEVTLAKAPTTTLYFDNRDHKEARLVCGQLGVTVAANKKERLRVPALAPGAACPLVLDGKEVGTLGEKDVLVDALGTRSYRWRTVTYGGALEQLMALNPQGGVVPPRDDFELFRAGHVHELRGKVDFFLVPAPREIKVQTFGPDIGGRTVRTELIETP